MKFKKLFKIGYDLKKKGKEDMSLRGPEMPQAVEFLQKGAEWDFIILHALFICTLLPATP